MTFVLLACILRRRMAQLLKQPRAKGPGKANDAEGYTDRIEEATRMQSQNTDFLAVAGKLQTQIPDVESDDYDYLSATLAAAAMAATALVDEPYMAIAAAALATITLEEMHMAIAAVAFAIATHKESNPSVAAAAFGMAALGEEAHQPNPQRTFPTQAPEGTLTETDTRKEDDRLGGSSISHHALEATQAETKRQEKDRQVTKMSTLPQEGETPIAKVDHLTRPKACQQAPGTSIAMAEIENEGTKLDEWKTLPREPQACKKSGNSGNTISSRLPSSGNTIRHKQSPGEGASVRQNKAAGQPPSEYAGNNQKNTEKLPIPNTRNTIASAKMSSDYVGTKSMDTMPRSRTPSRTKPVNSTVDHKKQQGSLIENRDREKDAAEWEKDRTAMIEKRYEKQKSKILSWENKKLIKARCWLQKLETKLQLQRERTTQKHRREMEMIDKIAGGAKVIAEEKKRNDESKMRAKANKVKSTGKVPGMCFGF